MPDLGFEPSRQLYGFRTPPGAGCGVELAFVAGEKGIGFQNHRAADMNGVHAPQDVGPQARHRLPQGRQA